MENLAIEDPPLVPLASASERARYQIHHHDQFACFAAVLDVAISHGIELTRADVSPECASWLTCYFSPRHCSPERVPLARYWRP